MDNYRIPDGMTGSPTVEVLLSSLGAEPSDLPRLRLQDELERCDFAGPVRVHTGLMPRLKLGAIFRDGVLVDNLPAPLRVFSFDHSSTICLHSIREDLKPAPEGWPDQSPYRILNKFEYPLGARYLDSNCLVASNDDYTLVIPCHEVLRALYAPHRELALALTTGPWQQFDRLARGPQGRLQGWSRVADPERTGILEDGNWHITLRKKVHDRHAACVANLVLNPVGLRAATSIHSHLMKCPYIRAELPFGPLPLRIAARCAPLRTGTNRFLALEIVDIEWPLPPLKLFVSRENDGREGEATTPSDERKPYLTSHIAELEDDPVPVTADEDPSWAARGWKFCSDGPRWLNGPEVIKAPKEHSFTYAGQAWAKAAERPPRASGGDAVFGTSSAAAADYRAGDRHDLSGRLLEVTAMFAELEQSGGIDRWWTVAPRGGGMWHGDLQVWRMVAIRRRRSLTNAVRAWSFVDPGQQRARGVLVCGISCDGSNVYWMEVEVRPSEGGMKSLVFRTQDKDEPHRTIRALLKCCSRRRGIWPAADALRAEAMVSGSEAWSHSRVGSTGEQPSRLNAARALAVIRRVARQEGHLRVDGARTSRLG